MRGGCMWWRSSVRTRWKWRLRLMRRRKHAHRTTQLAFDRGRRSCSSEHDLSWPLSSRNWELRRHTSFLFPLSTLCQAPAGQLFLNISRSVAQKSQTGGLMAYDVYHQNIRRCYGSFLQSPYTNALRNLMPWRHDAYEKTKYAPHMDHQQPLFTKLATKINFLYCYLVASALYPYLFVELKI